LISQAEAIKRQEVWQEVWKEAEKSLIDQMNRIQLEMRQKEVHISEEELLQRSVCLFTYDEIIAASFVPHASFLGLILYEHYDVFAN
jgi:hypothetical protein